MPKKDKNGKTQTGRKMKSVKNPKDCAGDCQYNVSEDVVENKKVKEKDVFDKPKKKNTTKENKGTNKKKDTTKGTNKY
tara:strand:- start:3501 stop:3734 length:234 start_codon:yes stop_codon:yes gene_type:complete